MIKIGFFSKLSQVPVKTLRYYDQIGLLNPIEVDTFTGYRYYSVTQLPRLNRILALKDLDLSLEQITIMLENGIHDSLLLGGFSNLNGSSLTRKMQVIDSGRDDGVAPAINEFRVL